MKTYMPKGTSTFGNWYASLIRKLLTTGQSGTTTSQLTMAPVKNPEEKTH